MISKSIKGLRFLTPGLLGVALASAGLTSSPTPASAQTEPASGMESVSGVANLQQAEEVAPATSGMEQVTSVSQLTDVRPTDWAFQALQSLVERYGCIVGYPDRTYRGNRAITRYEFAAGLNACMDKIQELITAATGDLVKKEDLLTLQRLQEEFAAELAALRGRIDALDVRLATVERQQFSTTTKLTGEALFVGAQTLGDEIDDDKAVRQDRVRLNFQTSFTGNDVLNTRLAAGNAVTPGTPGSLSPFVDAGTAEGFLASYVGGITGNSVVLDRLDYAFNFNDRLKVYVAAEGGKTPYISNPNNPYFYDDDGGDGAISAFAQQNPIYRIGGGAGAGLSYAFDTDKRFVLSAGYLAEDANDPTAGNGLFNGSYAAHAQLAYNASKFGIGVTYVHGYHSEDSAIFSQGYDDVFVTGTTPANLVHTGLGNAATTDSLGGSAYYRISPQLVLNAFGGYTRLNLKGDDGQGDIWYYGLGLALPDLLKRGNLAGIVVGVEPYLGGLKDGLSLSGVGLTNDTSLHVEAFYKYRLNDNVSITPGAIWITAPDQNSDNDSFFVLTLRSTFKF
ncbi:MAG TPA: iron uptake porin [Microcoleaceae cyanobacterium]